MSHEAFTYPLQAEHRLKTIGIGGLLHLFPVVIFSYGDLFRGSIVTFLIALVLMIVAPLFLGGYWLRVLRLTAQGDETPPEFTDWRNLLVNGLRWITVFGVYLFPVVAIAFLIQWTLGGLISIIFGVAVFALVVVALFLVPAAWTNVMLTGRLSAIFEFRNIGSAVLTTQYFIGIVVMIVTYHSFDRISGYILVMVIGSFVQFYLLAVAFYFIGSSCGPTLHEQHEADWVVD